MSAKPPLLFHYTSQEGFLGIVNDRAIRATNIHYLNDAAEFSYAVELLRERFKATGTNYSKIGPLADDITPKLDTLQPTKVFVAAFSENEDLLSQWRGYSPEGGGISLGFAFESFDEPLEAQGFSLERCEYNLERQCQILDLLAAKHINDGNRFLDEFFRVAPTLKHPSFSEECEWRLISKPTSLDDSAVEFHMGPSMLIPHLNFFLSCDGILRLKKLVVGPTPHMELAVGSARAFLLRRNVECSEVMASRIPYRKW